MAIDPRAVTIQESKEIAPTLAMLEGSMIIPEPIMFTATMNVSWTRLIFFGSCIVFSYLVLASFSPIRRLFQISFADHVGAELDATLLSLQWPLIYSI